MYRIMMARSKNCNYGSLYQYKTACVNGVIQPYEIQTKEQLDAEIQFMLNKLCLSKDDFIVVKFIDYFIDATDYTDDDGGNNGDGGGDGDGNNGNKGDDYPVYDGATTVRPSVEEQTLPTQETIVMQDITIQPIPISDVSNSSGGTTVTIG